MSKLRFSWCWQRRGISSRLRLEHQKVMIRPKRIYNFWLLHATFISLLHILPWFYIILWHFPETNLLTWCLVRVDVFWCFCIPEKLVNKYPRNRTPIYGDFLSEEINQAAKRRCEGAARWGRESHSWSGGHPWVPPTTTPRSPPRPPPLPIKSPQPYILRKTYRAIVVAENSIRESGFLFRQPAGGGNHRRRHLHHHYCLEHDAWVIFLGLLVHISSYMVISFSLLCFNTMVSWGS